MTDNDTLPCFLDCEASSLDLVHSYPIEVGWSTDDGKIESHLIDPTSVKEWLDWDKQAEDVHRIEQGVLKGYVANPRWVAQRMNQCLEDQVVYSDNRGFDNFWIQRLFDAMHMDMRFTIGDLYKDLLAQMLPKYVLVSGEEMTELKKQARANAGGEHRVVPDVRFLQNLYMLILGGHY